MSVIRWEDEKLIDRFLRLARANSWSSCWRWSAAITHKGYGRMKVQRKSYAAHRVAYLVARGPIPEGLQIDHRCKVRSCVNPLHLEAVPSLVNNRRSDCVSTVNAGKEACPQGHAYSPRRRRDGSRVCKPCNAAAQRRHRARFVGEPS